MHSPRKIFGIGLNKTGTTSLKLAFERLGFKHLSRKPRLFKKWKQRDFAFIWDHIAEFESFEDWPWPLMVPELIDRYGDEAQYILTRRRNAHVWVESLKKHAARTNPHNNPRKAIFGHAFPHGREAEHMAFYERHLTRTRAAFAAAGLEHRLIELCWEEGDSWPELCQFLNRPVPDRPFPRANQSSEANPNPEFVAENQRLIEKSITESKKI